MQRRSIFKSILAILTGGAKWVRGQAELSANDVTALRELGSVVLPASLGRARTDEIAGQFADWVRAYRAGADAGYGYGSPRLQVVPPNPSTKYGEQLRQIDAAALAKGAPFAKLDLPSKRAIVASALEQAGIDQLPQRPNGRHVAADLMAYFFNSSAGEDLLYAAAIRRDDCRGLANSGERPAPLH